MSTFKKFPPRSHIWWSMQQQRPMQRLQPPLPQSRYAIWHICYSSWTNLANQFRPQTRMMCECPKRTPSDICMRRAVAPAGQWPHSHRIKLHSMQEDIEFAIDIRLHRHSVWIRSLSNRISPIFWEPPIHNSTVDQGLDREYHRWIGLGNLKLNLILDWISGFRNSTRLTTMAGDALGTLLNPYQTAPTSSYFTTLPPLSPSTTTSTTTSTAREGHDDEAEEYDYEENGSAFDSDLNADLNSYSGHNGSQQSGCQLTRSASEEALPVRKLFSSFPSVVFFVLSPIQFSLSLSPSPSVLSFSFAIILTFDLF